MRLAFDAIAAFADLRTWAGTFSRVHRRTLAAWCTATFVLSASWNVGAQTPFKHQGLDFQHAPDSAIPNEQIDPASGTLTVVGTDLVLPGNAGFNLVVQRVYNSSVYPDYDSGGSTALEEDSWAGIGWRLHFGRIIHADSTIGGEMQVEMGDGSRHALYHSLNDPNIWTTTDFWLYNPATHVLQLPNGRTYTFDREVVLNQRLGTVRYVTEIRDHFQNRITFGYFDASGPKDGVAIIQQHLSATQIREITFSYDATLKSLATMTYLDRTWTYNQTPSGGSGDSQLNWVQPPVGPKTNYEYNGGELTAIVAPFGGRIDYSYADAARRAGGLTMATRVVTGRTMSGRAVPTGTWSFAYSAGTNQDTTIVTPACGTGVTKYRFNGTGISADVVGWKAGTLAEVSVEQNGVTLDSRTMTWTRSEAISNDTVSGTGGVWTDTAVYKPLLQQQQTSRGSHTWTTTFSYHTGQGNINDYGSPYLIEEVGDSIYHWRKTTRVFQYGFTPYLLGMVASESVEQNSAYGQHDGTTSSSWTYNLSSGFLTGQTARNITTTFEPRADGNVNAVIDGRGNRTAFQYSWGVVSAVDTPKVDATLVIREDGSVASMTEAGLTTSYGIDSGGRPSSVTPAFGTPITYQPDDLHGAFIRVSRGTAVTEQSVDAFGRETSTASYALVGGNPGPSLRVEVQRDTCGRVTFAGDPYTAGGPGAGTQGTSTQYDSLGRVKQVTDSAGKVTTYAYDGITVTRTDANSRATTYGHMAFGDPGAARLVSVTDALSQITRYRYDVTGALRHVGGPTPGLERAWVIGSRGLPDSDTQPESGTTTYTYDAVGNVFTRTDANQLTTTFTYDQNNRLLSRDAPGTDDDLVVTYQPDSNRIETLTGGGNATTFTYDLPNRKMTRTDTTPAGTFVSISENDANDNLSKLRYPSGRVVQYNYDAQNRLTSFDHTPPGAGSSTAFATDFQYGDDGRLASYVTGAVTHQFTYQYNRPRHISTSGGTDSLDLTYGYDNVGNVIDITDPRSNASQAFMLDPLDRLDTANGPWGSLHWTYDQAGNRLSEAVAPSGGPAVTTTYGYTAGTQRLMSTSGGINEAFTYDSAGQLTSDGVISQYTYSPTGKLKTAAGAGVSATYTYDTSGERFGKTVNGRTTYSVRAGAQTLSEYLDACGSITWSRDLLYAGGRLIGAAKAVATRPWVSFTSATASVGEAAGSVTLTLQITTPTGAALSCPVVVSYSTMAGTAAPGADYTEKTGVVTFAPGSASGSTQTITIPISSDTGNELDETFTVGLSNVTGGTVGATASATVTIVDDDLPQVSFAAATSSVSEAAGFASIAVTLVTAAPLPSAVTVNYATSDGTAVAGSDYTPATGTLTFSAGSVNGTQRTASISIAGDGLHEGAAPQTFAVSLSGASGATLVAPSAHTVSIVDDDPVPAPAITLDAPAEGSIHGSAVSIGGWAVDGNAPLGTGVTAVHVYAYPNADETQPGIYLGDASYGSLRSDVAGSYGSQFEPSGFVLSATLPGPGVYRIKAIAFVTLLGDWVWSNGRNITVEPTPRMYIDTPSNGYVGSSFTIQGWAIDAGAGAGTGIDFVQVHAYPNPGSGQPPVFLGTATYGLQRSDVAGAFGTQFANSGFSYTANLSPGYYLIAVYPHSTITNAFSQSMTFEVVVLNGIHANIDAPPANATVSQPFNVSGWAVDTSAASGNGVPFVHAYVYLDGSTPQFLEATPTVTNSRSDIGAWLQDSRFSSSGWGFTVPAGTIPAGTHLLVIYPYSSVTNSFGTALLRWITVQ